MQRADNPVTLLRLFRPRRPIVCSLCGELLGAWFQYQYTFYPYMRPCTKQCEQLLEFANERHHVPRQWRDYPEEWRAPLLAAAFVESEASNA